MAETWRPFHDALALRPTAFFIPDPYTMLEHTGDLLSQFEERNATANNNQIATTSPFEEDIIHSDLISDPVEESSEEEIAEDSEETTEETEVSPTVPQVVDDGLDSNTMRSNRPRNPPKLLTFKNFQAARHWQEMANNVIEMELFTACQAEAKEPTINLTLSDAKTFALESPKVGEPVIPTMETNIVKIKSDGSLDKLKCRIVVRGDCKIQEGGFLVTHSTF